MSQEFNPGDVIKYIVPGGRGKRCIKGLSYFNNYTVMYDPDCPKDCVSICDNLGKLANHPKKDFELVMRLIPKPSYVIAVQEQLSADEFLNASAEVMGFRADEYDQENGRERSMGKAIAMFNICTEHELRTSEGWLLLQLLKDVRQWNSPEYHHDSALDCVSYAALKAESLAEGD